jgi:hypothetical protein
MKTRQRKIEKGEKKERNRKYDRKIELTIYTKGAQPKAKR